MAHTDRREAHQRKREWDLAIVARGNDLAAQNDEPEPGEHELAPVTEGERIVARALAKREQDLAAYRAAREATAAAHKKWEQDMAALRASRPQQLRAGDGYGSYGMSCARCGGTPTGDSTRGYVGRCNCRSEA